MKLTDNIKNLFPNEDNSPKLKHGEIKNILISAAKKNIPDFKFLIYKNRSYYFQRIETINNLTVYEIVSVVYSQKDGFMDCNIGSYLNPCYIFVSSYNTGLINPHNCLKFLVHDTCILPWEKSYYFHNGRIRTIQEAVDELFMDCYKYGFIFFDNQVRRLQSNPLILEGLDYMSKLSMNKALLKVQLDEELKKNDYILSRIKHPFYLNLKEKLQGIKGIDRETRKEIPQLTYEFLELYADTEY